MKKNYPFGGSVAVLPGLLDAVLVSFERLVVGGVVLRLRHFSATRSEKKKKKSRYVFD